MCEWDGCLHATLICISRHMELQPLVPAFDICRIDTRTGTRQILIGVVILDATKCWTTWCEYHFSNWTATSCPATGFGALPAHPRPVLQSIIHLILCIMAHGLLWSQPIEPFVGFRPSVFGPMWTCHHINLLV
ncbi:hypothetical protein CLAIMM_04060 isoform 1 [Cladophialophora immunda]|nr:hypothetical protein CLAIMM_04060 isoform 1 [Cladophialophora immunda]